MNIALAPSEISHFLECDTAALCELYDQSQIERSIFVDYRTTPELSHSSIYDVLQHYVRTDVLEPRDDTADVEVWLSAIEELIESDGLSEMSFDDMVFGLMEIYQDFAPRHLDPRTLALRATRTLTAYFMLLRFIEQETSAEADDSDPLRRI